MWLSLSVSLSKCNFKLKVGRLLNVNMSLLCRSKSRTSAHAVLLGKRRHSILEAKEL